MSAAESTPERRPAAERREYRRVVVKAGSSLLTTSEGGLDLESMASIAAQIARLQAGGREMLLVSSGAVAAGRHVLARAGNRGVGRGVKMRQALAAIGQGRLMNVYEQLFEWRDIRVAQALLTGKDIDDREGYLNIRNTLLGLIENGVVPIINENDVVAIDELEGEIFGDNDMLSAMVANIVDADLLVMLGTVGGLFTADPNLDASARLIPAVTEFSERVEALGGPSADERGRGGMTTKLAAAKLATDSGVDTIVASGKTPGVITRLIEGEPLGTYFPTRATRMESWKRYLLSQMRESDAIIVDDGAAAALAVHNRSLLAAGVVDCVGDFERGDIVVVIDARRRIACGIANYASEDIRNIRRLKSNRIEPTLGHYFGDEVMHRDNMVVLSANNQR